MKFAIHARLPWAGTVIGFAEAENGSCFIVTRRAEKPCFVVHRYEHASGACHGGEYLNDRVTALTRMVERANGN